MMDERILPFHNYHRRATDAPREEPKVEEQPSPVKEVVLRALFHCNCEGCAKKFHKRIRDLNGVEEVTTDLESGVVVVKGDKLDPAKVLKTAQSNNTGRVELISPLPQLPPEEPRPPEIRHEMRALRVVYEGNFHCPSCAKKIGFKIRMFKGINEVELDFSTCQITVKGVFSAEELGEYIRREDNDMKIVKVNVEEDALKEEKRLGEMEREKKGRVK